MRYISIALFLLFSHSAFALDYYWLEQHVTSYPKASDPDGACDVSIRQRNPELAPGTPYIYSKKSVTKVTPVKYTCVMKRVWRDSGKATSDSSVYVTRRGDACPPLTVLNPETGICEEPPEDCSESQGQPAWHLSPTGKTRTDPAGAWPAGPASPTQLTMCSGACRYSYHNDGTDVNCGTVKGGDPLVQFCLFQYKGTGEACNGDPNQYMGTIPPVPPTDPNDPTDPANNCGPGRVWSGTTCVPVIDPDDPCQQNPNAEGCSGGGDPGGGDPGGGDPGGGDPGGGDPGGGDPCTANPTAEGCPGGGGGGGDPDPGDDEEDVLDGLTCDVPLECTGDAVQCAILDEQKRQNCEMEFTEEIQDRIADDVAGDRYKLQEQTVDLSSLFNEGLSAGRWLPSSCPANETLSLSHRSYTWSWEPQCEFAYSIAPLIVIGASIFFVIYVGRAFGSGGD